MSTINVGIRAYGGVSEIFPEVDINTWEYWSIAIFQISFYIIIPLILFTFFLAIIINTFAELRYTQAARDLDLRQRCFICGIEQHEFDQRGNGWIRHTTVEHSVHAYLAFIVYIRNKPSQDCTGLEKFVKEKIEEFDVNFFPRNAICFDESNIEETVE